MARGSRFVDYERHAARYHRGRSLPEELLSRWGDAVQKRLPPTAQGSLRVLDLGAGTGIFARAWPGWASVRLVALDAAEAMIEQGRDAAPYIQGGVDRLPLRSGSLDVVWISAAVHHFSDAGAAAAEVSRVLRPGGKVLIRGLVPGQSQIGSLEAFSASARAKIYARFPDLDQLSIWFGVQGFDLEDVHNVRDKVMSFAEAADWVEQMRRVDTMLTALTDAEIDAGLASLRLEPDRSVPSLLTLVTFVRR